MWLWIMIGLNISELKGYSNGNFPEVCDSMSPAHDDRNGLIPPQPSEPPFMISYQLGSRFEDPITVTLKSKDSRTFMGFMLQARNRNLGGHGPPVGKFISLDSQMTQFLRCSDVPDSAVSQKYNWDKKEFRVNWTAQGDDLDIIFRATFVQTYNKFWEDVTVTLSRPTSTSVPSTTELTTAATTIKPTESTTTESTEPNTTNSTMSNNTNYSSDINSKTLSTSLVCLDIIFEEVKMEISNIIFFANRQIYYNHNKVSMIVFSTLCVISSAWSLFFFIIDNSFTVTYRYVAPVSVVMMINFIEWLFAMLPLGHGHELNIFDPILRGCSAVHLIVTTVLIFFGVISSIDESGGNRRDSWPLIVMIAFTAWILLVIVWNFALTSCKKILQSNRIDNSNGVQERDKKVAVRVVAAVSVILLVGTTAFSVAVSVGLFMIQKN